jgi:plasmid maintenance system antidote protein VapI
MKKGRMSEQLKAAIRTSDLTHYEIAKRAGIAASAIGRFISGERGLTTDSCDRICRVLNLALVKRPNE